MIRHVVSFLTIKQPSAKLFVCPKYYLTILLYLVEALPHHDGVSPNHYHADFEFLCRTPDFRRLVQNDIHKLIVAP